MAVNSGMAETSSSKPDGRASRDSVQSSSSRHPGEKLLPVLLVLCAVGFLGLVIANLRDTTPKEGGPAPPFQLITDSGKRVTEGNFGGKVLVLNFWATWCAPCVEEIPSLNEMQKRFAKSGVVVVAVSVDKKQQKYRAFLDRIHVAFQTARDPSSDVSASYGTFQYPETYIIKDGRILRKFAQAEDWLSDDLTQYIQGLL